MADIQYFVGLDLGQARDFTALAVLERSRPAEDPFRELLQREDWSEFDLVAAQQTATKRERPYAGRHLRRFPLGTSYPATCDRIVEVFAKPPVARATAVVDQTGGGRAGVDMMDRGRPKA